MCQHLCSHAPCFTQTGHLVRPVRLWGGRDWGSCTGKRRRPRHFLAASQVLRRPRRSGSREAAVWLSWAEGRRWPHDKEEVLRGRLKLCIQWEAMALAPPRSQVTSPPARPQLPLAAGRSPDPRMARVNSQSPHPRCPLTVGRVCRNGPLRSSH